MGYTLASLSDLSVPYEGNDRMRQKENFKKGLVWGIIVLFIGMGIAPSIGGYNETNVLMVDPPSCYPVLNGTMGENDWYISCVTITFIYDPQEIAAVYFIIDDEEEMLYTEPFEVYEDGSHELSWRTVDHEGNWSDTAVICFKIDQTPPDIEEVEWETYKEDGIWLCKFTCIAVDETSGMNRVELYIFNALQKIITGPGPIYEFIMDTSAISFFTFTFNFFHYDFAGNSAFDSINGSDITSYSNSRNSDGIIEYPKRDKPYTVFISGECNGGGIPDPIGFDILGLIRYGYPRWFNLGAFFYSQWPWGPEYRMEKDSIFIINGEIQDIEYPVQIGLRGAKGFLPAIGQLFFKATINGKLRVFAECEEISLWYF